MNSGHLSEEDVQRYAMDESNVDAGISAHIAMCENCQAKAASYRLLFAEIKQQPKAEFGFNVSQLVLAQLPQPKKPRVANSPVVYVICAAVLPFFVVFAWLFGKDILQLFHNMSAVAICLVAVPLAGIVAVECYNVYLKYKKQIALLV